MAAVALAGAPVLAGSSLTGTAAAAETAATAEAPVVWEYDTSRIKVTRLDISDVT